MFNFIYLIAPAFFKDNKANILKYLKPFALCFIFIIIAVSAFSVYTTFKSAVKESIDNRVLIQKQSDLLNQQVNEIKTMEMQIKKLSESHEKTIEVLQELREEEKKLEKQVDVKKKTVNTKIKEIEKQDIPQVQKDELKSAVMIQGLNNTYCDLFPDNCQNS